MDHLKEAPDYLQDDHLSRGTKAYLKVLNGGAPVESLPVGEARRVLTDVQAAVHVDLSGIEESERTVESEGYTLRLNLVRPSGAGRVHLPAFVFIHGGGWVLGDYPTHSRLPSTPISRPFSATHFTAAYTSSTAFGKCASGEGV